MHVFRRGRLYLAYWTNAEAVLFDAALGLTRRIPDVKVYLGRDAVLWRPVFEDEPIPDALAEALIVRAPCRHP